MMSVSGLNRIAFEGKVLLTNELPGGKDNNQGKTLTVESKNTIHIRPFYSMKNNKPYYRAFYFNPKQQELISTGLYEDFKKILDRDIKEHAKVTVI